MKKFTSGLLPGSVRMSQRQYHLDVPGSKKGSFSSKSPLPKILCCKDKPRDQREQKDLGGRRHKTMERGKDVHGSEAVKYKTAPLTKMPNVLKCFVFGSLGRWELAGLLVLGITHTINMLYHWAAPQLAFSIFHCQVCCVTGDSILTPFGDVTAVTIHSSFSCLRRELQKYFPMTICAAQVPSSQSTVIWERRASLQQPRVLRASSCSLAWD